MKYLPYIMLAALAGLAGGCGPEKEPPRAEIGYYVASREAVVCLNRVAFIELSNDGCAPPVAQDMTQALYQAVGHKQLFHIEVLPRTAPQCEALPMDAQRVFSLQDLAQMREVLKVDAVLLGGVTRFQQYPRSQMGLYLRLIDLRDGKLAWGVDHIWDSTDKATEERIKGFFKTEMRSGYDPAAYRMVLMGPHFFQKFVAYEVAQTLPSKYLPVRPEDTKETSKATR